MAHPRPPLNPPLIKIIAMSNPKAENQTQNCCKSSNIQRYRLKVKC